MNTREESKRLEENNSITDRFTTKARLNLNDLLKLTYSLFKQATFVTFNMSYHGCFNNNIIGEVHKNNYCNHKDVMTMFI